MSSLRDFREPYMMMMYMCSDAIDGHEPMKSLILFIANGHFLRFTPGRMPITLYDAHEPSHLQTAPIMVDEVAVMICPSMTTNRQALLSISSQKRAWADVVDAPEL
jgi:hypothetical protein